MNARHGIEQGDPSRWAGRFVRSISPRNQNHWRSNINPSSSPFRIMAVIIARALSRGQESGPGRHTPPTPQAVVYGMMSAV